MIEYLQIKRAATTLVTSKTALIIQPNREAEMTEEYPTNSSDLTPNRKTKRDLTGQRFGRLIATGFAGTEKKKGAQWKCLCDCGNTTTTRVAHLRSGNTRSCGCLAREAKHRSGKLKTRHGHFRNHKGTSEYRAWNGMKQRCYLPTDIGFKNYGGRGIQVCNAWRNSFEAFLADVGLKPSPDMSLDRIDMNGNYEPGNVRWATAKEQSRNRRNNRVIIFRGEALPISGWSERTGLSKSLIKDRLNRGWDIEKALMQPAGPTKPHRSS